MKKQHHSRLGRDLDQSYEIDWGKFLYLVKEQGSRVWRKFRFSTDQGHRQTTQCGQGFEMMGSMLKSSIETFETKRKVSIWSWVWT